jgi:hypothetical protein
VNWLHSALYSDWNIPNWELWVWIFVAYWAGSLIGRMLSKINKPKTYTYKVKGVTISSTSDELAKQLVEKIRENAQA